MWDFNGIWFSPNFVPLRIQLRAFNTGTLNDSLAEIFNSIFHAVVQTTHLNGPILTLDEYFSKLQCGVLMAIDSTVECQLVPIK